MARRAAAAVVPLLSADAFASAVSEGSDGAVVVVDVHEDWAGPCAALEPTFRKLVLDIDGAEGLLRFTSVARSRLSEEQRAALPVGAARGCAPLLLVYKVRGVGAHAARGRHRGGDWRLRRSRVV
jgi:thiol-disulfide isomerase/thioredoxin